MFQLEPENVEGFGSFGGKLCKCSLGFFPRFPLFFFLRKIFIVGFCKELPETLCINLHFISDLSLKKPHPTECPSTESLDFLHMELREALTSRNGQIPLLQMLFLGNSQLQEDLWDPN